MKAPKKLSNIAVAALIGLQGCDSLESFDDKAEVAQETRKNVKAVDNKVVLANLGEGQIEIKPEDQKPDTDKLVLKEGLKPGVGLFFDKLKNGTLEWENPNGKVEKVENNGSVWVGKMESNGGREVILYVPNYDVSRPNALVFHVHGSHGELIFEDFPDIENPKNYYNQHKKKDKERDPEGMDRVGVNRLNQTFLAASQLSEQGAYNVVLAYPLSAGARGPKESRALRNGQDAWAFNERKTNESFDEVVEEVQTVLTEEMGMKSLESGFDYCVVEGHSVGGIAIRNIINSQSSRAKKGQEIMKVDDFVYLDANYRGWTPVKTATETNPDVNVEFVVKEGVNAARAKRQTGDNIETTSGEVEHGNLNRYYLGGGKLDEIQGGPLKSERKLVIN